MSNRWSAVALIVVGAALVAPERPVTACGPDLPTNLIVRRADALATMWDGSFVEEAGKLVEVPASDRTAFTRPPDQAPASAREQALYTAATEKFHAGELAAAARGFQAVLRLPPRERRRTSAAAAYSLGRAYDGLFGPERAIAAYRQVRALVHAGFADPDGLAISSLGQEARSERTQRGNLVASVRLYAQQAAHGAPGAAASLLTVVRDASPEDRAVLYRDDVGTRLLALYFYTRSNELDEATHATWRRELARHATTEARGAAYLAAAAYRAGEWEAARALAGRCQHAPLATWVEAKLALRDGDRARADALLRTVERAGLTGNPPDSVTPAYSLDADPRSLVRGELGLLALADQRFAEAADWFARGTRSVEAAYVAERVLSLDELLGAVQRTEAARRAGPPRPADGSETEDPCDDWTPVVSDHAECWANRLLAIYARRLLRAHRYAEALDAFGPAETPMATAFIEAMRRADASSGVERAEQLYRAARTLRTHGMEIAGTEVGPDWRIYDGAYERGLPCLPSPTAGYRRYAEPTGDDAQDEWAEGCVLPTRADATLTSKAETDRVAASAPQTDLRFSYRHAASRLAETAASLVPPRSQAYAESLCWAALFARRDRLRAEALYATYVRNGAAGFGAQFGEACEEPDFHAARTFDDDQHARRMRQAVAAERARAWTWPRLRAAAWRHKQWLAIPAITALLLWLSLRLAAARALHR